MFSDLILILLVDKGVKIFDLNAKIWCTRFQIDNWVLYGMRFFTIFGEFYD